MLKLVLSCLAVVLLVSDAGAGVSWQEQRALNDAFQDLVDEGVINAIPLTLLEIYYRNGRVNLNDLLTTADVLDPPAIVFTIEENCFYTLIIIGPDSPSPEDTRWRSCLTYLNVNIRSNVALSEPCPVRYYPPNPFVSATPSRYVFLLYKQPGLLTEDFSRFDLDRLGFDVIEFAANNSLYGPIAGNKIRVQHLPECLE